MELQFSLNPIYNPENLVKETMEEIKNKILEGSNDHPEKLTLNLDYRHLMKSQESWGRAKNFWTGSHLQSLTKTTIKIRPTEDTRNHKFHAQVLLLSGNMENRKTDQQNFQSTRELSPNHITIQSNSSSNLPRNFNYSQNTNSATVKISQPITR